MSLASPDVTLSLDMDGVIRLANLANSVSGETVETWVGRPWVETVDGSGGALVLGMVAEASLNGVADIRRITQRFPSGLALPFEYTMVRLGSEGLIAVGKNLRAVAGMQSRLLESQHTREQDAWKLRELETRNRLLFDHSDDPILLLRAEDFSVVEANPAAVRTGALDAGRNFPGAVAPRDVPAFRAMMAQVVETGRSQGAIVHIGAAGTPWLVRASRAKTDPDTIFVLRMSPAAAGTQVERGTPTLEDLLERLPDAFVVVDQSGHLQRVNRAFLDLTQMAAPAAALGEPIGRWLSQPGADASVLMDQLRRHLVVRNFSTMLNGELGAEARVEISAVAHQDGASCGIIIRDVSRRLPAPSDLRAQAPAANGHATLAPLAQLVEQIGRLPLMQLVRESGDLIERHCIEAALERSAGNRTAAAGLLGLSRQSLYAKLARHGLGGGSTGIESA